MFKLDKATFYLLECVLHDVLVSFCKHLRGKLIEHELNAYFVNTIGHFDRSLVETKVHTMR